MKAMLIWTIGDFPAYGMIAGCVTKGYMGCPICGPNTESQRSKALHKNVFCGSTRRFLEPDHHLRYDVAHFGSEEHRSAPPPVTAEQAYDWGEERYRWLREEGVPIENDPVRKNGIKRTSSLFRLPYWKHLPVRHTLDVMHIEKNVTSNLFGFVTGDKDTIAVRKDLADMRVMPDLYLQQQGNSNNYFKPHAPYVLTEEEKMKFFESLSRLKTPGGHCGNFQTKVDMVKLKLYGMKSHDYHIFMEEILPALIRGCLQE